MTFVCQSCGAKRPKWEGRCTDCGEWNSFVEEFEAREPAKTRRSWVNANEIAPSVLRLDESLPTEAGQSRLETGIAELDRVLGGGLFVGSFVLLGGAPGIGKSTLTLQMIGALANRELGVLYVSAEESTHQTQNRAHRLGIKNKNIMLAAEGNLEKIFNLYSQVKPKVLIIDSIQTVFMEDLSSAPGSVSQVRECANQLMTLAKTNGCVVFLIGHVTKDGHIAGPKVLEHMVDTVLSFEGDSSHQFRLLRAVKNRFGPAHELGVFTMGGLGLQEVGNPSEMFLEERGEKLVGSTVFPSVEGSRPLLCEIQALSTYSPMSMPRRTAIGFDVQRVHLLMAVLSKQLGINLNNEDIFINVVGGLKIMEPAGDLAVVSAVLSSHQDRELSSTACYFGEVGLTGEVRAVPFADLRIREALKLGFKEFYLPASNKKHLDKSILAQKVQFHWIKNVKELL